LSLSAIHPETTFSYSDSNVITMSPINPGKTSLTINKSTGAVSGTFTLVDGALTRKVSYFGMIVRPLAGNALVRGWFLAPQIPGGGETASTSPILSGSMSITQ